jgi:hypothetical protein
MTTTAKTTLSVEKGAQPLAEHRLRAVLYS